VFFNQEDNQINPLPQITVLFCNIVRPGATGSSIIMLLLQSDISCTNFHFVFVDFPYFHFKPQGLSKKKQQPLGAVHKRVYTKSTPSSLSEKCPHWFYPPCPCGNTIYFEKFEVFFCTKIKFGRPHLKSSLPPDYGRLYSCKPSHHEKWAWRCNIFWHNQIIIYMYQFIYCWN